MVTRGLVWLVWVEGIFVGCVCVGRFEKFWVVVGIEMVVGVFSSRCWLLLVDLAL